MTAQKHYLEAELENLIRQDPTIWRFLQAASLDGVWYWDLEDPDNEYMSPEFWRLFGYDPATKAHLASEWQDMIFAEDLEVALANFHAHVADPNAPYDQIVRYRCKDGSVAWVRCRGIAIRDDSGKAIRLLGAHNDITAEKENERLALRAQAELERLFDTVTSGIIVLDKDARIIRINSRGRHILGGVSDPVPFDWPPSIEFLDPETMSPLEASADPLRRAMSGNHLSRETHLMRRLQDGETGRYVRMEGDVTTDPEVGFRLTLVIDDVSNEERNRQVVERKGRLDALGQLTGGIAHDFNNLLASLLYAIDLARQSDNEEDRDNYLRLAGESIERGRDLTARLLAFARKQPGLARVRSTRRLFTDFAALVRPMIEARIDITFSVEDETLHHFCDQTQLETALMNVILNSRDAILRSGKGSHIEVKARAVRAGAGELEARQLDINEPIPDGSKDSLRYIEISVSDNGPGMDEETLARCTDPFFTTKASNSGTGLGLAIVYGFLRQSDGDLRIYSEPGVGTNVQMILPRGNAAGGREAPMPQEGLRAGNGETILLVEDELQLLAMMTDLLEDMGYVVVSARSGEAALELIDEGLHFDLLLTDVVMPGTVGGFDLATRARALRPDVPVIYASGYTGFTASEMGAVQAPILQKPARPADLAEVLHEALGASPDA